MTSLTLQHSNLLFCKCTIQPVMSTQPPTPQRRILVAFHGRYFLSWWHFDVPRYVCQSHGNLSRWIHGGLLNIPSSWHVYQIHIFSFSRGVTVPFSFFLTWTWIYLPPYVHANWKDRSIGNTNHFKCRAYAPEHHTLWAHTVFFCEHDGQGGSSRMLCRRCLLSPEL